MTPLIETSSFAATMRRKVIRPDSREILIARLAGSDQEQDLTLPANCGGLGRIRHFLRPTALGWPQNSLPIDPASKALGLPRSDRLQAQVFQNAACAWRCWYCYVPFNLLSGDASRGDWATPEKLIALYTQEDDRPSVIDLSGGSPDLTPEWVPWMMKELAETTYLWSDDNLSTDYVFTKLEDEDRQTLANYRNYGRVCCIKGFDAASFAFNTIADSSGYNYQFEILQRYMRLRIDLYGYVTLTGNDLSAVDAGVSDLFNRLCSIHEAFPLRVVPLKIDNYATTASRSKDDDQRFALADAVQSAAIERWNFELQRRYSVAERAMNIADVML
jgi:uncharacterized Fe-S cluster-containing radical SAM superfamily protein